MRGAPHSGLAAAIFLDQGSNLRASLGSTAALLPGNPGPKERGWIASLASAPITDIKVLATGLGIGILLDATVVRALLVPSIVVLLGDVNWWFPPWLARLLRVPLAVRPAA